MTLQPIDKTVRVIGRQRGPKGGYEGPDYSSFEGAKALLKRVRQVRAARGEPCDLKVVPVARDADKIIYGLRPKGFKTPIGVECVRVIRPPTVMPRRAGVWYAHAMAICNQTLERHPGITLKTVLGTTRSAKITAARYACIRAVFESGIAETNSSIARFFNVHRALVSRVIPNGRRVNWLKEYVAQESVAA